MFLALTVLALAATLLWVIAILRHIVDTLGKVTFGVRAIARRTEPIGSLVEQINTDLGGVADALEALASESAPPTSDRRGGRVLSAAPRGAP